MKTKTNNLKLCVMRNPFVLLLIGIILLFSEYSNAQTSTLNQTDTAVIHEIEIKVNGKSNFNISRLEVPQNKLFQLKFTGLNPLLYKYTINGTDSSEASSLELVKLINSFPIDKFTGLINTVRTAQVVESTDVGNEYASYHIEVAGNNGDIGKVNCNNTFEYLLESFKGLNLDTTNCKCELLSEILMRIINVEDRLKSEVLVINTFNINFNKFVQQWAYRENSLDNLDFDFVKHKKSIETIKRKIQGISKLLEEECENAKDTGLIKLGEINQGNYDLVKVLDTSLTFDDYGKISAAVENYDLNGGAYYSLPMQISQDFENVAIDIAPYDDKLNAPRYKTALLIKKKKYFGFELSTGFMWTTLANDLVSARVISDSTFQVIEEGRGSNQIGINAMVHGYADIGIEGLTVQIGIGPTLLFQKNVTAGIAYGFGVRFGGRKALSITVGRVSSFVSKKSKAYSANGTFRTTDNLDLTINRLDKGAFFNVGFNFLTF